jgi:hypothetical protein
MEVRCDRESDWRMDLLACISAGNTGERQQEKSFSEKPRRQETTTETEQMTSADSGFESNTYLLDIMQAKHTYQSNHSFPF